MGISNRVNILNVGSFYENNLKTNYEVNEEYKEYEISGGQRISLKDVEVYKVEF